MEIKGVSIDSRTIRQGELFVAIKGDRFDGHDFIPDAINRGAWGAIVERTILESRFNVLSGLRNIIPVEDTLQSLQEMAALHRKEYSLPVVGITGSNGKTTTKEMLASILRIKGPVLKNEGNLNNHIGVPLTLLKLSSHHAAAVIEMGMSGAGEIDLLARIARPDVGVITNIGPAHLQFFSSTDDIAAAKGELFDHIGSEGTAVLNADDKYFDMLRRRTSGRVLSFGLRTKADVTATDVRQDRESLAFTVHTGGGSAGVRMPLVGTHNVQNALAAVAAALAVGVTIEAIRDGLENFSPVAMRSEVRTINGRTVLADYYNANPRSVEAALDMLIAVGRSGRTIAVLGDMLELGDAEAEAHRAVGATAARLGVDVLITYGALAKLIAAGAVEAGMARENAAATASHDEAARLLRERSRPGDTILVKGSRAMKMEKILEAF